MPLGGCMQFPSGSISASHQDYNEHLRQANRDQLFYNIVALQHNEVPHFLTAASVVSQLSRETSLNANANVRPTVLDPLGDVGAGYVLRESPTITFTPLHGDNYSRLLLTPFPPVLILALAESGWPVDKLLFLAVRSINGISNDEHEHSRFHELASTLRIMQQNHELTLVITREAKEYHAGFVVDPFLSPLGQHRLVRLRELLGFTDPKIQEFSLTFKAFRSEPNELAISTRSIIDMLRTLGSGLSNHSGFLSSSALNIERKPGMPEKHYVKTKYKDNYYWIDESDNESQQLFMLIQLLIELTNTPEQVMSPVLTISS